MIKNANNIITYGDDASGDQDMKDQAIGEAYAYRAFGYFQLVQLYGKRYVAGAANSAVDFHLHAISLKIVIKI